MSAEVVVKKRGRPKKVVFDEPVIVVNTGPNKQNAARKSRTTKATPKLVNDDDKVSKEQDLKEKTISTARNVADAAEVSSKTMSTTKRVAKKVVKNELANRDPSISISSILQKADAFVRKSKELIAEATEFAEKREQSSSLASKANIVLVEGSYSADHQFEPQTLSSSSGSEVQHLVRQNQSASGEALEVKSKFLQSFFNDPEPLPVPPAHLNQPESKSEALSEQQPVIENQSTTKDLPAVELQPANSGSKVNTTAELASTKPSVFAIDKALPVQGLPPTTSIVDSILSQASSQVNSSSSPTPDMKPTMASPQSKIPHNLFPKPAESLINNQPQKPSPPPSSGLRRVPLSKMPPSSSQIPSSAPPQRPPPLRPTQMPYSELKKNPQYRQLTWKYTGLMVGIPLLGVTSWQLWTRYEAQQKQRQQTLAQMVGWEATNDEAAPTNTTTSEWWESTKNEATLTDSAETAR